MGLGPSEFSSRRQLTNLVGRSCPLAVVNSSLRASPSVSGASLQRCHSKRLESFESSRSSTRPSFEAPSVLAVSKRHNRTTVPLTTPANLSKLRCADSASVDGGECRMRCVASTRIRQANSDVRATPRRTPPLESKARRPSKRDSPQKTHDKG